ncbi:aspartate kinase [Enterococcus hirae]|nr:aspartate kinase [Enterococcus hirae]
MKVVKFGGSSLADAVQFRKVGNIIKSDPERTFVVVSAPGKRFPEDTKVTDLLIRYFDLHREGKATEKIQQQILDRYHKIVDDTQIRDETFEAIRQNITELDQLPKDEDPHIRDAFLAAGEDNNARLMAGFLNTLGLRARYLSPQEAGLLVTDEPGDAQVLDESYANIYQHRDFDGISVVPGFFGMSKEGKKVTFSRGGSDITGAIIAAGVKADLYENFTDVPGIYSAHPGVVDHPQIISQLTYREMRELAYAGFSVFHDEALMPAYHAHINVVIKDTNQPDAPGTLITMDRHIHRRPVVGIASDSGFMNIYLRKYLLNRELGFGRRALQVLEDLGLHFEHMPSGIDEISIILREDQLDEELERELIDQMHKQLQPEELTVVHDLSIIMMVGEGMQKRVGVVGTATEALAHANISLDMINQGFSELSIMFGLSRQFEKSAVRALYHAFFDEEEK